VVESCRQRKGMTPKASKSLSSVGSLRIMFEKGDREA
jgi:hypothetical protein